MVWNGYNISIILFFSNAKTEINDQEVLLIQININFLFISLVSPELEVETSIIWGKSCMKIIDCKSVHYIIVFPG